MAGWTFDNLCYYYQYTFFYLTIFLLQISPVEIENVIRQHPGVQDVAVTGIEDPECGDLPVACVVIREGHEVTADEIKQLVKGTMKSLIINYALFYNN